jgi:hypothetical protein
VGILQLQSEIFKSNENSFLGESQREGTDLIMAVACLAQQRKMKNQFAKILI